jgi:hypothetical protein
MRMHTPTRLGTHMHARTRKHAHTGQYVILIAFPQQQLFHERVSVLRYTYKVVQIWPGQTLTCFHTNSPGHSWPTLYIACLVSLAFWLVIHGPSYIYDTLDNFVASWQGGLIDGYPFGGSYRFRREDRTEPVWAVGSYVWGLTDWSRNLERKKRALGESEGVNGTSTIRHELVFLCPLIFTLLRLPVLL